VSISREERKSFLSSITSERERERGGRKTYLARKDVHYLLRGRGEKNGEARKKTQPICGKKEEEERPFKKASADRKKAALPVKGEKLLGRGSDVGKKGEKNRGKAISCRKSLRKRTGSTDAKIRGNRRKRTPLLVSRTRSISSPHPRSPGGATVPIDGTTPERPREIVTVWNKSRREWEIGQVLHKDRGDEDEEPGERRQQP